MDTAIEINAKVRPLAKHDDNIEASALIRSAYADYAAVFASLAEARIIFASIVGHSVSVQF